ncbi:hypothetical protein F8388_006256 [Cannabis sativa]|uniref:Uncharacterized protein n=1 Tax=Cannabis sativa TaxID=3483 RepID=A0A7J6IC94_CANSA|nr:hypothetical protein F8388_006256 [Cannabis sativa]KAF4404805.1 hypothetical protein G4B88_006191 [Cannabis sativa]
MGNCVPVLRIQDSSKSKCLNHPIIQTSVSIESQHQKPEEDLSVKPQIASFPKQSSTEEMYFDSQAWLDSDCEDYFSVNGDKSFHKDEAKINSIPRTSQNKLLFELFRESFNSNDGSHDYETKPSNSANKSSSRLSVVNTTSSTVNHNPKRRKTPQPVRCCIPNLVRSVSSNESKKTLSPS